MKRFFALAWRAAPWRGLVEAWLLCLALMLPLLKVILDAPPYPFSLYLVLLPLVCAVAAGLRLRFFPGFWPLVILKETAVAVVLGLGLTGLVVGLLVALGGWESIQYSYAGTGGTHFFLLFSAVEYLGVRAASWVWQRWNLLRRRQYVWALTHSILCVLGGFGLLLLVGVLVYLAWLFKGDIWGIPPDSIFAQAVFWLTILVLFAFFIFVTGIIVFLPPAVLFSFLMARTMTRRLENLAGVTEALRRGDLSARIPVKGEDEIAQLQANFNSMAADLEKSVLALQSEKDRVEHLLEARRELVAGVSHELRNPTAVIQGYSDSLRRNWKQSSPEEVDRDLGSIQYEAERLQTILNDLLTVSQLESGHLKVVPQALDVIPLLQRLVETFNPLVWHSKRVQVTLEAPSQAVLTLADPLRLEQILVNLVQNAVRHTSPGGLVTIEVHSETDRVQIGVEDTGEGITPEDLPLIWEKYFQVEDPQHRTRSGTGLGLSLVKELTESMGGSVSVKSWPGQGSLFVVSLPVSEQGGQQQTDLS